jgi:formylglycine-generating enzyme required for sulfatase activity
LPQVGLSPEDVQAALLPKLQQHAPAGFRFALPTEAQWEFACRAGTGTAYYAGNDAAALDGSAWYAANSTGSVRPVADLTPNAFGLYDMHGNVSEICRDTYVAEYYLECPVEDPLTDVPGEFLVLRGGSVLNTAQHCRSAYRSNIYVANRYEFAGVRLALVPAGE